MHFIKTFQELAELPNSTKICRITNGQIHQFILVGSIKQSPGLIIANDSSLADLTFLFEKDFKEETWTMDFEPEIIGNLLLKQVRENAEKEIEKIKAVYLK